MNRVIYGCGKNVFLLKMQPYLVTPCADFVNKLHLFHAFYKLIVLYKIIVVSVTDMVDWEKNLLGELHGTYRLRIVGLYW